MFTNDHKSITTICNIYEINTLLRDRGY